VAVDTFALSDLDVDDPRIVGDLDSGGEDYADDDIAEQAAAFLRTQGLEDDYDD
jgi:hypothetical protein